MKANGMVRCYSILLTHKSEICIIKKERGRGFFSHWLVKPLKSIQL